MITAAAAITYAPISDLIASIGEPDADTVDLVNARSAEIVSLSPVIGYEYTHRAVIRFGGHDYDYLVTPAASVTDIADLPSDDGLEFADILSAYEEL